MLNVAQMQADYAAAFARRGENVIFRRYGGTGAARAVVMAAQVLARVYYYKPEELVGAIKLGDRKVIALNNPAATIPGGMVALSAMLPLSNSDKVVIGGVESSIEGVDDQTRRMQGTLIALEIQVRG